MKIFKFFFFLCVIILINPVLAQNTIPEINKICYVKAVIIEKENRQAFVEILELDKQKNNEAVECEWYLGQRLQTYTMEKSFKGNVVEGYISYHQDENWTGYILIVTKIISGKDILQILGWYYWLIMFLLLLSVVVIYFVLRKKSLDALPEDKRIAKNNNMKSGCGITSLFIALLLFYLGYQASKCQGGYCDVAMMATHALPILGIIFLIVAIVFFIMRRSK